MNSRIIILILLVAIVIGGIILLNRTEGPVVDVDSIRAELPTVEMGEGSTTVTVPTDVDIERREHTFDSGRTIEYPAVDVETEERVIEYPTLEVEPAPHAPAPVNPAPEAGETAAPVMSDPHDPVPPVDVDVDEDGNITATQPAP